MLNYYPSALANPANFGGHRLDGTYKSPLPPEMRQYLTTDKHKDRLQLTLPSTSSCQKHKPRWQTFEASVMPSFVFALQLL